MERALPTIKAPARRNESHSWFKHPHQRTSKTETLLLKFHLFKSSSKQKQKQNQNGLRHSFILQHFRLKDANLLVDSKAEGAEEEVQDRSRVQVPPLDRAFPLEEVERRQAGGRPRGHPVHPAA